MESNSRSRIDTYNKFNKYNTYNYHFYISIVRMS